MFGEPVSYAPAVTGAVVAQEFGGFVDDVEPCPRPGVALVAEGRRTGRCWCIWCNSPVGRAAAHEQCRKVMGRTGWVPCLACFGGGIDTHGGSCWICHGVGFVAVDDVTASRHAVVLGLVDGVNW